MKRDVLIILLIILFAGTCIFIAYKGGFKEFGLSNNSDEQTIFEKNKIFSDSEYGRWRIAGGIFTTKIIELGTIFDGVNTGIFLHRFISILGLAFLYLLLRKNNYDIILSTLIVINIYAVSFAYYNSTISLPIFMTFFWIGTYFDGIKRGWFWAVSWLTKFSSVFLAPFFLNKVWKNKVWLGIISVLVLFLNEIIRTFYLFENVPRDNPHNMFSFWYWSIAWLSDNTFIILLLILTFMGLFLFKNKEKIDSLLLLSSLLLMFPILEKSHLQYFIMWSCMAIYSYFILNKTFKKNVQYYKWIAISILCLTFIHRVLCMFILDNPLFGNF